MFIWIKSILGNYAEDLLNVKLVEDINYTLKQKSANGLFQYSLL
jgi:hypothetical protein